VLLLARARRERIRDFMMMSEGEEGLGSCSNPLTSSYIHVVLLAILIAMFHTLASGVLWLSQ
jgi:hypothetical protein